VAGTNTFYVNENNNHVELFVGIENILKIFRVDFISAYDNGNRRRTSGISIGFGGLLGSSINNAAINGSQSHEF
jgi:hypothetical protein